MVFGVLNALILRPLNVPRPESLYGIDRNGWGFQSYPNYLDVRDRTPNRFDEILAVNGYHPIRDYMRALKPGGIYAVAGGELKQCMEAILLGRFVSSRGKRKVLGMITKPNQKDLVVLSELQEAGKIAPIIDRSYPLAEVPDAIRYLMEGHPRGKVVITTECKQLT